MNKIILIVIFTLCTKAYAESFSMRDCMLLPITDSVGNALGFKVYETLENHLKDEKWCEYKSSADLLSVFSKYRERLKTHLQDPEVIKTVANRIGVGTIIRIDLNYEINSISLNLEIIGETGDDIYFKETVSIENADHDKIVNAVKNWLEVYEASIPYDGKVMGVLGDQVTFSLPQNKRYGIGQEFKVKRFVKKTKHRLLNTVVEWDSTTMGRGRIFNISKQQALGIIKVYNTNQKIKAGDWIKLENYNSNKIVDDKVFPEIDSYKFGKLGTLSLHLNLSSASLGTSPAEGSIKMSGITYGIGVNGVAWLTRNYFAFGEFRRSVGVLTKSSGTPAISSANISYGAMKIGGGYKYLPMGFFYGPQVDLYVGYSRYSYNVEASDEDGFGENALSGFMLGVGGSLPIQKRFRLYGKGEIIPYSNFDDESDTFSSAKSSGSMYFNLGARYQYHNSMTIDGGLEITNNSARLESGVNQINYRDTMFKIGTTIVY